MWIRVFEIHDGFFFDFRRGIALSRPENKAVIEKLFSAMLVSFGIQRYMHLEDILSFAPKDEDEIRMGVRIENSEVRIHFVARDDKPRQHVPPSGVPRGSPKAYPRSAPKGNIKEARRDDGRGKH